MNIALIGFRGTGKTTLARILAQKLGMRFVDLDEETEKIAGMKVSEIFGEKGEKGFRETEKKAVSAISGMDGLCIACGGGVVLDRGNIDSLKRNSTLILLTSGEEKIWGRIKGDKNRPVLSGKKGLAGVKELLLQRKKLYEESALFSVDTSDESPEQSAERIILGLRERGLL